jgi:hypothetical protein
MLFLVFSEFNVLNFPCVAEMISGELFARTVVVVFVVSLHSGPYQPFRQIFAPVVVLQL